MRTQVQLNDTKQAHHHQSGFDGIFFNIKKLNKKKAKIAKDNVIILVKKNVQNKILFKLPIVPPLSPLPLYHCPEAFSSLR